MGGYERNGDRLVEYDLVSDHWQSRASLPRPLHHIGAAAVNGKIYVIGGYVSGVGLVATVYEYNPAADQWRSRAHMPTLRSGIAAASLNQRVFVFGGESDSSAHNQTESYEPASNKWQRWTPMPIARHGLGVAVIGQPIDVLAGGPKPGASYSSVNEMFTA